MRETGTRTRIIFHIGLEKTGTTSFQRFCFDNRRDLLEHGVLYPTQSLAFSRSSRNHAPLVAAYLDKTGYVDLSLTSSWRPREKTLASLRREIDRAKAPVALISAEHFSSRLCSPQIELLARDFADCACAVAIVLRDHESLVCSAYSSTIRSGRTLTLGEYVDELTLPGNGYIRYADTIARWRAAFGRAAIQVFQLESGRNVIADLACRLFGDDFPLADISGYAENQSYGKIALEALRRVNASLPPPDGGGRESFRFRLASFARARLLKSFALMSKGKDGRLRLDAAQRAILSEIVDRDRCWLTENYGVDLPPLGDAPACSPDEGAHERLMASELLSSAPWTDAALLWLARNSRF